MSDIFTPPEANLHDPIADGEYGSIEKAIEGRYSFKIREILSEAWANLKGFKRKILIAALVYLLISFAVQFVLDFILPSSSLLWTILNQLVHLLIVVPLLAGLYLICIKRSVNAPTAVGDVFSPYNKTLKILAVTILMYLMIFIGILLLVLPGIYLMIAYMMVYQLAVDKNLGIWETLEASRKAVTKRWFKFLAFFLLSILILVIAAIPLGIGLLWAAPLLGLAYGILYRNMFGVEPATINE